MILNMEQDNAVEGNYLRVLRFNQKDSSIQFIFPENFYINNNNCEQWLAGWGTGKPLYDAGVENLWDIKKIDIHNQKIFLGNLLRGKEFPSADQRIVFWNKNPSSFKNYLKKPILTTSLWPEFSGQSINFSSVNFDSTLNKWVMIVNECDTNKIQIYAAVSEDLIHWSAANNGNAILKTNDFIKCNWGGWDISGKIRQTPFASDIIHFENKWYLFLDGYDASGKRNIGIAVSNNTLLGPYRIYSKKIIPAGENNSWNESASFYAKVKKYKNGFIMFYDGRNSNGKEAVGMATSDDLINWANEESNPVLNDHRGWNSSAGSSEPNYINIINDSILLMICGSKKFKMGPWNHYITKRMYMDVSGNVNDNQSGIFLSVDGGKHFTGQNNNPVFINDYSNKYENEHLGGNFKCIDTDTAEIIIYQAKSSYQGSKYNILLRSRTKCEEYSNSKNFAF